MASVHVTIRRFAAHEWRIYRDLRLRALADSPDAFGSTYEREAAREDAEWESRLRTGAAETVQMPLVAFVEQTPAGLAWARVDEHDPTVAHLFQVWVAPEYRGQGIGRLMTNTAIAWARDLGVGRLRLGVTPSHPAARHLYRQAGFVDVGEPAPLRPGSPVNSQPMELHVDQTSQMRLPNER